MKKKKITAKERAEYVIFVFIIIIMITMIRKMELHEYKYQRYETATLQYVKATIVEIKEQNLEVANAGGEYLLGYQKVIAELLEGKEKGKKVEINNYLTVEHNVVLKEGCYVIVCADIPINAEPYYTIYNYYRNTPMAIVLLCFFALVVAIGKKKGAYSFLGLMFTLICVVCYLLPNLYEGKTALNAACITVVMSTVVSCFCISGISKKTCIYAINTILGTFAAALLYALISKVLYINGCSIDEAESLLLIAQNTNLQMNDVLFSGIMITSLGAVMDVAVSIGAALSEIAEMNTDISVSELFKSGMNIGKDMIGTMTNTLILAFAGGSIATLIVLISYGVQFNQLISSNYLTLEVAKGLAGSSAVVLTVPISAGVCAVCYGKHRKNSKIIQEGKRGV